MLPAAPVMATRTGFWFVSMRVLPVRTAGNHTSDPMIETRPMSNEHSWTPPADGQKVRWEGGSVQVPDRPIVCFIEGDGTGPDIWRATKRVLDAAVAKSFGGRRSIAWHEILAGEKARDLTGEWLPQQSLDAMRELRVGIKGPLTTPVGGGFRSLNVALR